MPYCPKCGKKYSILSYDRVWNYKEHFPEFYAKPLCRSCYDELKHARAIEELCEHLSRMGLNATVESKEHKRLWGQVPYSAYCVEGSVRVADRNIDFVELHHFSSSRPVYGEDYDVDVDSYRCGFVVEAKVEGLEDKLRAEGKPVRKSFFSRKVVDFKWKGKELAQSLGSDTELRSFLLSQRRPSKVEIEPWKEHQCVRIREISYFDFLISSSYPEGAFPTIETFEAYDRIAQHIRNITGAR